PVIFGQRGNRVEGLLSDCQDLALKRILIGDRRVAGNDRLADPRHRLDDLAAEPRGVGRDVAPANEGLALGLDVLLDMLNGDGTRPRVPRQKAHRDRIPSGLGQAQPLPPRPIAQQRVRHLNETAGPVTDERVGPDRAAMVEIDQDLQTARDDIVRFSPLDVGDETDTARIMLVARVVEALSPWQSHRVCSSPRLVDANLTIALPRSSTNAIICTRLPRTRIALTLG